MDSWDRTTRIRYVRFTSRAQSPENRPQTMASWLDQQFSSHRVQLAAAALISGAAVAGAIYGTQAVRRKEAVEELKASIPDLSEDHRAELVGVKRTSRSGYSC